MTYAEYAAKHIQDLENRLRKAGIEPIRTALLYMHELEMQCEKAGLSISIEPATVMIRVCDGVSEVSAAQGVRVILIDLDINTSDKAEAEFDRLWDQHIDSSESIDMTVSYQFIED
jgi:hypothetical protein